MATLVSPISVLAAHFNRIYGHVIITIHLLRFPSCPRSSIFPMTAPTFNLCEQFWSHESLTDALVVIEDLQKVSIAWVLA